MNKTENKYKQLSNAINVLNPNIKFIIEHNTINVLDYSEYDYMFGYKIILKKHFNECDNTYKIISNFYDTIKDISKFLNISIVTTELKNN